MRARTIELSAWMLEQLDVVSETVVLEWAEILRADASEGDEDAAAVVAKCAGYVPAAAVDALFVGRCCGQFEF